jgi:hypothetical protein
MVCCCVFDHSRRFFGGMNRACLRRSQLWNADQVVGDQIEHEVGSDAKDAAMLGLADLVITPHNEPKITLDNLDVAQFIYLLLNNERVRDVINTITSKVVLILGRFADERKPVLDAIREELRRHDWLPVLFDFAKPTSRDITETVSTLAHMARLVIADITDAKSM